MTMRRPLPSGLQDRAAGEGLPMRVVHATAFVRCLADWRKDPQLTVEVAGDGPIGLTVVAGQSFVETAKELEARVTPGPSLAITAEGIAHEATADTLTWEGDSLIAEAHARLLERLAGDAGAWHGTLPESLPPQQVSMRRRVNATTATVETALLHQLFWDSATRTPQKIALIDQTRTVTYQQLRHGAANLAEALVRHGAGPGKLVAVIMNKGWEQAAAVLGILTSGAAYVPIAPDLPEDRILHLLRHAQASIVVTQPGLAGVLPRTPGVRRMVLDDTLLRESTFEPVWQPNTDLAYVIYTSGSTGLPKGVMIDHRGAVNTLLDINRRFGVGPHDRAFALSSLGFDLSVYDIFGLLAAGGAVVFPAPGTQRAPWEWLTALDEHDVTVWNSVPALMDMLVTYAEGRRMALPEPLRLVLMSGDWIPVTLPDRVRALSQPGIVQIGMGGATEASIWSNFYQIGRVDPAWPSIPYGKPLTNQFFEVLDGGLRRRPDGVPGELYIGGVGVAMGYWRDEEKTRRSFVNHPTTGQRLYRTGDLGRYRPDGNLEFLGRDDFQVKVHGYRVELGEIEATLVGHPDVTGAVVIATESARRLVAFVTPSSVSTTDLLGHVRAKLPGYMVPDRVVPMDAFPLSANGKVDRPRLARDQV